MIVIRHTRRLSGLVLSLKVLGISGLTAAAEIVVEANIAKNKINTSGTVTILQV